MTNKRVHAERDLEVARKWFFLDEEAVIQQSRFGSVNPGRRYLIEMKEAHPLGELLLVERDPLHI